MDNEKKLLFSLESGLYSEGAPVVITSGRLIGDCVKGGVYAEFTLQNISRLELRSVTLRIQPLRSDGTPLGPAGDFHYFNMTVPRGETFGKGTPIMLPDCYTQSFSVSAINAMFFDGSTWDAVADAKWEPFPRTREGSCRSWAMSSCSINTPRSTAPTASSSMRSSRTSALPLRRAQPRRRGALL